MAPCQSFRAARAIPRLSQVSVSPGLAFAAFSNAATAAAWSLARRASMPARYASSAEFSSWADRGAPSAPATSASPVANAIIAPRGEEPPVRLPAGCVSIGNRWGIRLRIQPFILTSRTGNVPLGRGPSHEGPRCCNSRGQPALSAQWSCAHGAAPSRVRVAARAGAAPLGWSSCPSTGSGPTGPG